MKVSYNIQSHALHKHYNSTSPLRVSHRTARQVLDPEYAARNVLNALSEAVNVRLRDDGEDKSDREIREESLDN